MLATAAPASALAAWAGFSCCASVSVSGLAPSSAEAVGSVPVVISILVCPSPKALAALPCADGPLWVVCAV
ncbi:hypothetical protein D3C76_1820120 [compost metagenome]